MLKLKTNSRTPNWMRLWTLSFFLVAVIIAGCSTDSSSSTTDPSPSPKPMAVERDITIVTPYEGSATATPVSDLRKLQVVWSNDKFSGTAGNTASNVILLTPVKPSGDNIPFTSLANASVVLSGNYSSAEKGPYTNEVDILTKLAGVNTLVEGSTYYLQVRAYERGSVTNDYTSKVLEFKVVEGFKPKFTGAVSLNTNNVAAYADFSKAFINQLTWSGEALPSGVTYEVSSSLGNPGKSNFSSTAGNFEVAIGGSELPKLSAPPNNGLVTFTVKLVGGKLDQVKTASLISDTISIPPPYTFKAEMATAAATTNLVNSNDFASVGFAYKTIAQDQTMIVGGQAANFQNLLYYRANGAATWQTTNAAGSVKHPSLMGYASNFVPANAVPEAARLRARARLSVPYEFEYYIITKTLSPPAEFSNEPFRFKLSTNR